MTKFMPLASILTIMGLIATSSAYDFYVGGRDGWVPTPRESYSSWAGRLRFQINDQLVFRYKKGEDSVLVVKKEDYDTCNVKNNPIQKLEGGESTFKLDRSGPFFFISGVPDRCAKGEKLIVVVLADRSKKTPPHSPPSASPSISPSSASPSVSPPSASPSVSPASPSPSVSPPSASPSVSPAPSPLLPVLAPAPSAESPGSAGGPSASEIGAPPPMAQSAPPGKSASAGLVKGSRVTIGGMVAVVLSCAFLG